MGAIPGSYKKKLLATSVSSCLLASVGVFAQDDQVVEEVLITGVRAAQISAVNTKRNASSIVDAISAEDIGKLPDVTISDSLQRVPGIQIRRSAGEGAEVNIRGLPQVITQLNGEQYIGANSITDTQPNFNDIPSQLFKGAEVYKSATGNNLNSGISGTVNLQTYRPFDLKEGFTAAGSFELQSEDRHKHVDPVYSALLNWQNEKIGFLFSGAVADVDLANYYNGVNGGGATGDTSWVGNTTINGAKVAAPQGFAAWNQSSERKRVGYNSSLQVDLGEGFELVADWFYTRQNEFNRKVGLTFSNKWAGNWDYWTPMQSRLTGDFEPAADADSIEDLYDTQWAAVQVYDVAGVRLKSFTQNDSFKASSSNLNLQLNYDNGGPLTGSVRYIQGDANKRKRHGYNEGDMSSGCTWNIWDCTNNTGGQGGDAAFYPTDSGGEYIAPNPYGYTENPQLRIDNTGAHPLWSGFERPLPGNPVAVDPVSMGLVPLVDPSVADYMRNITSYNVGAFSSENNYNRDGSLDVFRLDGSYKFDDMPFFTRVDMGLRSGQRSASNNAFHYMSRFYGDNGASDEAGCLVQWKATDVVLNRDDGCTAGAEDADGNFRHFTALSSFPLYDLSGAESIWGADISDTTAANLGISPDRREVYDYNPLYVTDFGPVEGIPGVWAVDPREYDNPAAFHTRVFGNVEAVPIPGSSYTVDLNENSYYLQLNFEQGPMSGNMGFRVIETDLSIKQNIAGNALPYGNTNVDNGDVLTKISYTDFLPAVNVNFDISDSLILRLAASENMTPLDLDQWGDGLVVNTAIDTQAGSPTEGTFLVTTASLNGNPDLKPWRSSNFDVSLEWYSGEASMLALSLFSIKVDSFPTAGTIEMDLADADGVVREPTVVDTQLAGSGGKIDGVELSLKHSFDYLEGIWGNFGVDANYTYSPSEQDSNDVFGNKYQFIDNSDSQFNLIGWYQGDRLQARIAYNYRSDRLQNTGQAWSDLGTYQQDTVYVDASVSYDITEAVSVYVNGSNITNEFEEYYLQWEDQYMFQNYYEARYSVGLRAKF